MVENALKSPPKFDKRCGSTSGYYVHKRRKEFACQPCRDALAIYSKEWRVKYPEKGKIYFATGKMKHPDKNKEKHDRWVARNPQTVKEMRIQWKLANFEKWQETSRANSVRKRVKKLGIESEAYTTQQILDLYGTDCHVCKEPIDLAAPRSNHEKGWEKGLQIDHVLALSRGGTDLISNVKPSHGICNAKKWIN